MNTIEMQGSQLVSGGIGVPVVIYPETSTVYFPDNAILRDKKIKHIDICDEMDYSLSGQDIFKGEIHITFFEKKTQTKIFDGIPGSLFETSVRNGNRLSVNHNFDLPMSYIKIDNNTLIAPKTIYFVFWYDEPAVLKPINCKAETQILDFENSLEQKRTYFKENNTLKDAKIRAILFSEQAYTATGQESIDYQTRERSFVTLRRGNLQFIQNVPLYLFLQNTNAYLLRFENVSFDFTNSYIEIVNPVNTDYKNVFFNVIIEK